MPDAKERLESMKTLSISISLVLDILGFSKKWTRERICAMDKYSKALSSTTKEMLGREDVERIVTGSIREGIGLFLLNDIDFLQIDHGVICGTDYYDFIGSGKLVFELVQKDAPCGYCFLRLLDETPSPTNGFLRLQHALVHHQADRCLSSTNFIANTDEMSLGKGIFYSNDRLRIRRGPSLRKPKDENSFTRSLFVMADLCNLYDEPSDFVRAFPCKADSFLQEWKNRDRPSGWPYKKAIAYVMSLPGYVVPVGQKGTKYEDLQWRICFTDAEIHLVQALNCTQKKIYILLKLVAKHSLKSLSADITSYVMKMVILWLAEKIPQRKFRRKHLLVRLKDAVIFLKESVRNKNLPNYMIPSRNMFAGKLQGDEQLNVIEKLHFFLENAYNLVREVIHGYILNTNEGQKHLISIFMASWINNLIVLHFELYSADNLAYLLKSLLKCETYGDEFSLLIPQYLKFFRIYGNRPICLELTLRSRLETLVKQQQLYGQKQKAGGNKQMLDKNDKNENDEVQRLLKKEDKLNDFKWVIPAQLLLTLQLLIYTCFQYVLLGTNDTTIVHVHVYILVLYLWCFDDKKREEICSILARFYLALAVHHLYIYIMICGISGYLFKPFILHTNQEGKVLGLFVRTNIILGPLVGDAFVLMLNADTIYCYI